MNQQLTDITVILDKSGSMHSLVVPTIKGYNNFKTEQEKAEGECVWTEVQFSSPGLRSRIFGDPPINADVNPGYQTTVAPTPIGAVRDLDGSNYRPGGGTALYDAVGNTINTIGKRLASTPEADRPGTVIVVITTDGFENASVQFTGGDVKKMIEHQETKYGWQFIFMGANQDAIETAGDLGIAQDAALSYAANHAGATAAYESLSANVVSNRKKRSKGVNATLTFSKLDRQIQYDQGANDQLNSDGSA